MAKKRESGAEETEKVGLREKLCKNLDIPPDLLPGAGLVEIRGQNAVMVKGCGRILVYTSDEIRVALKKGYLRICGKRLVCTSYYAGAIGIEGLICGVLFEEEKK